MSSLLPPDTDEYLVLLTVDEAACLMRIGRTKAYAMAREYINSGGTAGLPVISFGPGCLRVPRWALVELITTGRVPRLCDAVVDTHARVH
jgi:hypothetical protein